jgi:hypothetical protein
MAGKFGGNGEVKDVSLGDDFCEVIVRVNGARFEVHVDGSVDAYTQGAVRLHPVANDSAAKGKTAPEIGDEMADGTIYAGISPDTHKPMYARPKDESGTYTFNEAAKHAKNLEAHGHHDFRAPSKGELNVLWENRNKGKLAGTFNETGSYHAGWYWSSTPGSNSAWAQRFSDGYQNFNYFRWNGYSSLRCVR